MRHEKLIGLLTWFCAPLTYAALYVNGGGGITDGTLRYSQINTTATQTVGQINGVGQVGVGFADHWGTFFGGLELGTEWQGFNALKTSTVSGGGQDSSGTLSTQLKNDYYLHIKPGYVVQDAFALYGILGILRGRFTVSDVTGDIGNITGPQEDVTRTGYRIGLGIANLVTNHFEWRVEYTYNGYAHIDSTIIDNNSQEPIEFRRSNIAINQVLFGLGYYF